ncbi:MULTISPECIES: YfhO family protein [unclassified Streptomyces]|uniref:YfhO family protein n=1 Tax=unclassified Streptomyces TaxID=2593676 RepID=UPI001F1151B2|nr:MULTISPECIES: YfhO family protein [unclassified Streptomyces]
MLAPACAGLLTALVFVLATALARSHPLGPYTRNVVDLGQQYLPYHAYWRAFLLGDTHGDAFLNWNSGFGAGFLGDIGTYLSSPFSLLVVLFPADRPELALYVITALKITAAGAAMAALLIRLRPAGGPGGGSAGPWPLAALLGAAYALSGWTFNHGASVPMWLDGLIAFPLLCLVAEWARTGRRPVLGPLVVAVAWIANFYTAYMATLGAALFLAVRLLTAETTAAAGTAGTAGAAGTDGAADTAGAAGTAGSTGTTDPADTAGAAGAAGAAGTSPVPPRLAALLRAVWTVGLGVGLAAPVVLVVFRGTGYADPTPETVFAPASWTELFGRFLPATVHVETPALFVGTPALLLALTLPFNRAVAPRVRYGWTAAVVLVTLSLQWGPTHLLWHAGASPNGNPYRQTFVLCGLLLIAAWLSGAPGVPRPAPLVGAAALLGALALAARTSTDIDAWTYPVAGAALLLAVVAALLLLLLRGRPRPPALAVVAAALLLAAQAGEAAVSGARVERQQRADVSWAPRIGGWQRAVGAEVARADAWPAYRTDPGPLPGGNEPLLLGGQGADAYSSLTTENTSRTLDSLGFGHYAKGRHPETLDNPVTDAIFSIGTRIRSEAAGPVRQDAAPRGTATATTTPVPPLVTVHPGRPAAVDPADSAFRNQELLLGSSVYALPAVRRTGTTLTARCPAGAEVWFWAPEYHGTAALAGAAPAAYDGRPPTTRAPMRPLGTVPAGGEVRIRLVPERKPALPRQSVGCLDRARLAAAVTRLTATGATRVTTTGHALTAELPPGSTGLAVVAVPRATGWRCAAGDAEPVSARSHRGLLAVPLDGRATRVSCSFRPPGVRLGAAVGAAALLALAGTALLARRRARRPGGGSHEGRQEFTGRPHEARSRAQDADYAARRTGA